MVYRNLFKTLFVFLAIRANVGHCQETNKLKNCGLNDAHRRYARQRCLQDYPQADTVNYNDTAQTHCYLQCFLYKMGLIDLTTRGLDNVNFNDILENIYGTFTEDTCMDNIDLSESLNGKCSDSYRKLMEFRNNCLELFENIFINDSAWKSEDSKCSKKIGQSATEFCELIETENTVSKETSQDEEESLLSQYKDKLTCIFKNVFYLDAYGRVNEAEIVSSFQEAHEDSPNSRAIIRNCSHRANAKYQQYYLGDLSLELEKCLKVHSPVYDKVFKLRDETSKQY